MSSGRYNLVVYLGSGKQGRERRTRLEHAARVHGYVNKKGKVKLAPYVVAKLEDKIQSEEVANKL